MQKSGVKKIKNEKAKVMNQTDRLIDDNADDVTKNQSISTDPGLEGACMDMCMCLFTNLSIEKCVDKYVGKYLHAFIYTYIHTSISLSLFIYINNLCIHIYTVGIDINGGNSKANSHSDDINHGTTFISIDTNYATVETNSTMIDTKASIDANSDTITHHTSKPKDELVNYIIDGVNISSQILNNTEKTKLKVGNKNLKLSKNLKISKIPVQKVPVFIPKDPLSLEVY
jgi:hypothetical protein